MLDEMRTVFAFYYSTKLAIPTRGKSPLPLYLMYRVVLIKFTERFSLQSIPLQRLFDLRKLSSLLRLFFDRSLAKLRGLYLLLRSSSAME